MRIFGLLFLVAFLCRGQGIITTVAGFGQNDPTKGGPAISANLTGSIATAEDNAGNIYINGPNEILKVDSAGNISLFAGSGHTPGATGGPATSLIVLASGVGVDSTGNLYVSAGESNQVFKVTPAGILSLVAGTGDFAGALGDGGPATQAVLNDPDGVAVDGAGNIYIADFSNNLIRKVNTAGIISTVAGTGSYGHGGDGGLATAAQLDGPTGVAADPAGNIYIVSSPGVRVREVDTNGIISTVAGDGSAGFFGDGGAATSAKLSGANAVAADTAGNLYISDKDNFVIRKVDSKGIISTVAGNGTSGNLGDGIPATEAELQSPTGVSVDPSGNLYITDFGVIREVTFPTVPKIAANGVFNGASFQPGIVPGSWATIQGSGLSLITDSASGSIVNGRFPTTLDGISVTVGGQAAYMWYVSPGQINFVVPDVAPGSHPVIVKNSAGSSSPETATVIAFGPAFFPWPNNQVVATHQDFSPAVKNGTFGGAAETPAQPGETIILWGTGFGPTTPAAPAGLETPTDTTYSTSTLPTLEIDNVSAKVYGAALAPEFVGLYQVAIQVPTTLGNGDWPIMATIGGVSSPAGTILTVHQ